jgi:hypothetical protein
VEASGLQGFLPVNEIKVGVDTILLIAKVTPDLSHDYGLNDSYQECVLQFLPT